MVQAEENTYNINPRWYDPNSNLLNSTQQSWVCNNFNFLKEFDTIWYFTDTNMLVFGNYISTDSDGYVSFSNCYVLESNGNLIKQSEPRIWRDRNNVGAVYKSSGAFGINNNDMSLLNAPCVFSYIVTLNSTPNYGGSVSGGGTFESGSQITINATPATDYTFTRWSDGNTSNPRTLTVNSNINLSAIFTSTISVPGINLPDVNVPNISVDSEQNSYINTYGSNAIKGGRVTGIVIDYYNIYSVVQTTETDEFFNSRNDNYYIYQQSNGEYIFPVYDHSELQVFAPNMNVSNQRINLVDYAIGQFSYVYVSSNNAIIQRDVSTFNIKYIDELQKRLNGYDKLPFSNSSNNKNHLEYLGVMSESEYFNTSSSSIEIPVPQEGTSGLLFYFVVTDNYSSIQNATSIDNQTVINSNMNNNFNELDTQLKDMASTNDNGQLTITGNELITQVESKATSLFYPITWSIDLFNDMASVESKSVLTLPALFKPNSNYEIDLGVIEEEIPTLFTFIRSIIWIALALLCVNSVHNIIGGGNNDN